MVKKNHKPATVITILVIVVSIIGGFYYTLFNSRKNDNSKTDTNTNLTQVIQNQNADKFLEMFDSNTTKSSISKIGAKSILLDWNQNSTEDISKISSTLKRGKKIAGSENNYHIKYEETTKMLFIKQSKLTTMTSKLIVPVKLKKATIKVDGKNISYSDLTKNNLFPGVYDFEIKLGKAKSTQRATILGDGRSSTLMVPKQEKDDYTSKNKARKTSNTNTGNNQSRTQTPKDDTNVNDASNDPEYREPALVGADDLAGNWKLVDAQNNEMGIMPETITFTHDNITAMYPHNIQTSTPIDSVRYSDEDDTDYFTGSDSPNPFAAKLVKKTINGKERVVMEHLDQGAYGWYIRQ